MRCAMDTELTTRPAAFSIQAFADQISVSRGTVYNLHKAGLITIIKIGGRSVVRSSELDRFLDQAPELGA